MKLVFTFFIFTNLVFSQEEILFSSRYQDYLKGDLTFIANNILNRNEKGNTNEAYNKLGKSSKLNDEFKMSYIDIDNDLTTFSSSSAIYIPKNSSSEIVFAGLYWSATYKYSIGNKEKEIFLNEGQREPNFNEIKIKTPGSKNYTNITGEILFDGFNKPKHKTNAPYACFCDITNLVKNNPNGEYTIANIKATEGYIEGGSSGGWILYFVYKNDVDSAKYISLYDGFASIYDRPIEVSFINFLTPKTGEINSKIAMAILEGDTKIDGDNIRIKNENKKKYFYISTENREEQNFFNSQITIEKEVFQNRNPRSLNTLGFDALLLTLNNKKNSIISNDATQTSLRIGSSGDKFYIFSTGFTVNIDEEFYQKNKNELIVKQEIIESPIKKEVVKISEAKTKKKTEDSKDITQKTISTKVESNSDVFENKTSETFYEAKIKIENTTRTRKDVRKLKIKTSLKSGYYIVANVFSIPKNHTNYSEFLDKKNIPSSYFINPENNYYYVYLKYSENLTDITNAYDTNLNNTFFDDYWILSINID